MYFVEVVHAYLTAVLIKSSFSLLVDFSSTRICEAHVFRDEFILVKIIFRIFHKRNNLEVLNALFAILVKNILVLIRLFE